jgi:DNA polymerase III gamma/tau subunit
VLTLDSIFGQDSAVNMLRRAFAADRLPHAMLFAGPRGVGKATTARALGVCAPSPLGTTDQHPSASPRRTVSTAISGRR